MKRKDDTIAAIATGLSAAAVSVVRLSGPRSLAVAAALFTASDKTPADAFEPYRLYPGRITGKRVSDRCMCVVFKAPHSYTGEDCAEFHCHGGVKLTECVLNELLDAGARLAEPGEFTKRAFLNGKLDLSAAEGITDLINAQSEAEINAAFSLLSGALKNALVSVQDKMTDILAGIDAAADYPEEYDGPELKSGIKSRIYDILKEIKALEKTYDSGALIRNGINCAIAGMPNTGKSSLMNRLLGYERAIVTPQAGTTRDTVTESFSYGGVRVNLIDTAGLRRAKNNAESLGIERAKAAAAAADIVIYVQDYDSEAVPAEFAKVITGKRYIFAVNKIDEGKDFDKKSYAARNNKLRKAAANKIYISAKQGLFTDDLKRLILDICIDKDFAAGGAVLNNIRHLEAVRRASGSLAEALASAEGSSPLEMVYVDIKEAWDALGLITGTTATEEIIDALFSQFCVGK